MSRRALALVALAGLLLSALWLWSRGDERRIDRNLKRIQKLVAKGPAEGRLEGLRRAQEITGLFADSFAVEAEPLDFAARDRRSLAAGIHQYRSFSSQISMRIRDREHGVDGRLGGVVLEIYAARHRAGGRFWRLRPGVFVDVKGRWAVGVHNMGLRAALRGGRRQGQGRLDPRLRFRFTLLHLLALACLLFFASAVE